MNILKSIGLGLLILVLVLLVVAFFMPKDLHVEKTVVINKPLQEVFSYVRLVKNQDKFSYWNMQDPNAKKEYTGTDGTVGFVYSWDSQNSHVGKGSQTIAAIDEGKKLNFNLHFDKPFKADDKAYITTEEESPTSTKVTWGFDASMKWPMNLMSSMMQSTLSDQLQTSLDNLKKILEGGR